LITNETQTPAPTGSRGERSRPLEVYVLFTDITATLSALRTAAQLAQGLAARIRLLLIETVPYPLPLDAPRRNVRFLGRQFRTLVESCPAATASRSVPTEAEILLCRDAFDAIRRRLPQESVIVIGKRSSWWPQSEDRLAGKLRSAGHHVVRTSPISARGLSQFGWKGLAHA
jgi:hypothetical protein